MSKVYNIIALTLALFSIAGCGEKNNQVAQKADEGTYPVFVSIQPLVSIAESLVADKAEVTLLMPAGSNIFAYEPPAEMTQTLARSGVLFYIGMGLDDWSAEAALKNETCPRIHELAAGVPTLPMLPEAGLKRLFARELMPSSGNRFVWLDPMITKDILLPTMTRALSAADPPNSQIYNANSERLAQRLSALNDRVKATLEPHSGTALAAYRGSFTYFMRRYKLELVETMEPFVGIELSSEEFEEIAENCRKAGVKAVLVEAGSQAESAERLAKKLNIKIIEVDPIGAGGEGYIELLQRNAEAIANGLK